MSNLLLWIGISLIIRCLNSKGLVVGSDDLIGVWTVVGIVSVLLDVARCLYRFATTDWKE